MTTAAPPKTYNVSWTLYAQARAYMQFEAPAGLSEEELKTFIREECDADFKIDSDDFEYDDGFADLDISFEYECVE